MDLTFVKITKDDLEFINKTRNECAAEYLHNSQQYSLEETYDWFDKTNPDFWIIIDLKYNTKIGYFRLSNYSKENKNIYIGADIAPEYRGKGYGKIAYKMFIPYLFKHYGLHKITLEVLSTNTVAKNLYEKLGFIYEGKKREEIYKKGKWIDSIIMSILRSEYKQP